MFLGLLTSDLGKYAIIGITILSIIGYFKYTIYSLENNIENLNVTIKQLELNVKTANDNTDSCIITNVKNSDIISKYSNDIDLLKSNHSIIINAKNKEITKLKSILVEMRNPVIYTNEVIIKECKIKTKYLGDNNETNTVLNSFNSIGF